MCFDIFQVTDLTESETVDTISNDNEKSATENIENVLQYDDAIDFEAIDPSLIRDVSDTTKKRSRSEMEEANEVPETCVESIDWNNLRFKYAVGKPKNNFMGRIKF